MPFICRDVVEKILSYIEAELDRDTLHTLEEHLHECPECMEFVRTYKKMLEMSGRLREQSFVTPELRERLKKMLLEKSKA